MNLTRKFLRRLTFCYAYLLVALSLSSCSMYRNAGRKNFEASTPGQIHSMTLSTSEKSSLLPETTCWQQSADEPLWQEVMKDIDARLSLTVHKLNNGEIEVCFTAPPGENL